MRYFVEIIAALLRRVEWVLLTFLMYILRVFPIKKNKIVFLNYFGKGYGDNAKYICNELLLDKHNLDIVWVLKNMDDEIPNTIRKVKYKSLRYYYEMCTAKVWVDNCRKPLYERKRKGQFYIQTWHADMGLKKAEGDAKTSLYPSYIKSAKNDSKMADLFISGTRWMSELYKKSYWYNGMICECGYPRRDIIYNITQNDKKKIKNNLNINENEKVVLYAPTFRNDNNLDVYKIEWEKVINTLEKKFSGKWRGLIRLHPNLSNYENKIEISDSVINVTSYPDMQELLAISDICITDYSSCMLEFAVTGKPAFIFASDYDNYKKDRDVYFELNKLPFSFAKNNDELIENIMLFDSKKYLIEHSKFYRNTLGVFEQKNASKEIANIIRKYLII